ncbi:hypothetical protein ACFOWE_12270 [Planomonospora corallina]|uniref:Uncharacterized protein n=1 Tax=Planomonospora corallina TaxID=1806052 RepID=A0ABV8I4F4_9ACTN
MPSHEHIAPIFRAALETLREAGRPLRPDTVREEIGKRVEIAPEHRKPDAHGQPGWWAQLSLRTGEAAALGWMVKRNGWSITEVGARALEDFPGDELHRELTRQFRARRLPAPSPAQPDPHRQTVLDALAVLKPGTWTTHGDLAELAGTTPQATAGFVASSPTDESTHRILQADGRVPPGFRQPGPGVVDDPLEVLRREGLRFDPSGRADPSQRLTAGDFRAMLGGPVSSPMEGAAPTGEPEDSPAAFEQFQQNLGYARQLVDGGRNLERLKVGAFDVTDLYRAAWTQAVAALDHWVTREIVERGVALARQPEIARPPKFTNLSIPVELFEKIHHHNEPLGDAFRNHLERFFGFMTFQNPEKIKEGFAHVSTVNLWPAVAKILTDQDPGRPMTADEIRTQLREIARRRNSIAHTADHDPERSGRKNPITAQEAEQTIDSLESMAIAILLALGDPLPAADYDSAPAEAGALGAVPASAAADRADLFRGTHKSRWDEDGFLHAVETYCPAATASTLLTVYRHAESHPAFRGYYFGQAAHPSVTAWFSFGYEEAAVWSIYTGVSRSVLSVNFEWMSNRGVSRERLGRLADALGVFPGWAHTREQLSSAGFARRPSLTPPALARPDASEIITKALNGLLAPDGDG